MIPASTPKVPLQLTRMIHDKGTPVPVAKRYNICLPIFAPPPFWLNSDAG